MNQNLNEQLYTVIVYRPEYISNCPGPDFYYTEAEHRIYTSNDIDVIAEKLARLRLFNDNRGMKYIAYEYTVFINGHLAIGDINLNDAYISDIDKEFIEQRCNNLEERVKHFKNSIKEESKRTKRVYRCAYQGRI